MTRFRDLRIKSGLTQTEFRHLYNEKYARSYTAAAISQIEHGRRMPELGALVDFADFYGVSLDYLLERDRDLRESCMSSKLKDFVEQLSAGKEDRQDDSGEAANEYEASQESKENIEILRGLLQQSVLLAQRVEKEAKHS